MAVINPDKSLATKNSNSHELYENRKVYKEKSLMSDDHVGTAPDENYILDGFAEFWYDRQLYGKINRQGDIIIMRENFLKVLKTDTKKTFYALNIVALAFAEMKDYFEKETASNRVANKKTLFALLNPAVAWESIYDKYHDYISDIYTIFIDYLELYNRGQNINTFDDFIEEFFIFCRNIVIADNNNITLSGFITDVDTDSRCGGLTIDLFRARASNDILKEDLFIKDRNFDFFLHCAGKHGFVVNKNVPWRLTANLSSDYMKLLMESPAFDVTYGLGPRHIFDTYYLKTHVLDLIFLRKYMYDMYNTLVTDHPFYTKFKFCNENIRSKNMIYPRRVLTTAEMEKYYTVKDYWMEKAHRFRLAELTHDLNEEDIKRQIKSAKSIYNIRGEQEALKYLHNQRKRFFLNEYNKLSFTLKNTSPKHKPEVHKDLIDYE